MHRAVSNTSTNDLHNDMNLIITAASLHHLLQNNMNGLGLHTVLVRILGILIL